MEPSMTEKVLAVLVFVLAALAMGLANSVEMGLLWP